MHKKPNVDDFQAAVAAKLMAEPGMDTEEINEKREEIQGPHGSGARKEMLSAVLVDRIEGLEELKHQSE